MRGKIEYVFSPFFNINLDHRNPIHAILSMNTRQLQNQ